MLRGLGRLERLINCFKWFVDTSSKTRDQTDNPLFYLAVDGRTVRSQPYCKTSSNVSVTLRLRPDLSIEPILLGISFFK